MREYETTFIVQPEISDEGREALCQKLDSALEREGSVRLLLDDVGKRKLAYEINDLTDGDYTLINFHADPTQIAELDRVLRITDAVVRHMIVRRDDQE